MLRNIFFWKTMPAKFWIASIVLAILPDIDALGFYLGVPYGSTLGHRGFTHSILFALIVGVLIAYWLNLYPTGSSFWWLTCAYFCFVVLSHPLLDAMTTAALASRSSRRFRMSAISFPGV